MRNYFDILPGNFLDVGPASGKDFVKFLDVRREHGPSVAASIFPTQWEWYEHNSKTRLISDLPAVSGAGLMFSERAFSLMGKEYPELNERDIKVAIDGLSFHWWLPPVTSKAEMNSENFRMNVFIDDETFRTHFSEAFVNAWKSAVPQLRSGEFVIARFD